MSKRNQKTKVLEKEPTEVRLNSEDKKESFLESIANR
jgi:hypothetical protein